MDDRSARSKCRESKREASASTGSASTASIKPNEEGTLQSSQNEIGALIAVTEHLPHMEDEDTASLENLRFFNRPSNLQDICTQTDMSSSLISSIKSEVNRLNVENFELRERSHIMSSFGAGGQPMMTLFNF